MDDGPETDGEESHEDDLAFVRFDERDPGLGLDHMSTTMSINRLSNGLVDLGSLIARRLRERIANRRSL
jgi:hypothetical protein